jgi:menaquinone-dependent protoporphyrinogen oxidase
MSPRVLIIYGTTYGQTARVVARIGSTLRQRGFTVTTVCGDALPPSFRIDDYDGVLVGASMIRQGYQKYIRAFVAASAAALNAHPSAFFAVSGSAGSSYANERAEAQRIANAFCAEMHWTPAIIESIAGAIMFTKYNFILRWVMKRISRKEGRSTDTSRDHEYTDWAQVTGFAERFADVVLAHRGATV